MSNFNQKTKKPFNSNKPKKVLCELKVKLGLPANVDENLHTEIMDVLANTLFNKISISLTAYRSLIDHTTTDADDTRVSTIGYIRDYDANATEFTVVIYNNFVEYTKMYKEFIIEPIFTTFREGGLKTITKFNLTPCEEAVEEIPSED